MNIEEKHKFNGFYGKLVNENVEEKILKEGKKKFNLLEDINFQIAMESFNQYNDRIANMYDNTDIFSYSEIESMKNAELEFELKESIEAIRYLQLIINKAIEYIHNNYPVCSGKELLSILQGSDKEWI